MNLRMLRIVAAVGLTVGAIGGTLPLLTMLVLRHANAAQQPTPPGSLAGVVRDSDGHPITGATVVAGAFINQPNHLITTTGADGRFSFQPKEGEQKLAYVLAYKEGLAPASQFRPGGTTKGTPAGDLELTLAKAEPFVGAVRDRGGAPIAGARVRVRYMRGPAGRDDHNPILDNVLQGTPLESLFRTTTDKQGGFRFPAVPPPHRVVLNVSADGMADLSSEVPGDYEAGYLSGTATQPARLTMEAEARIKGRVVIGFPGPSVVGLKVALQSTNDSTQFWRTAKTDNAGRFEFRGLPEGGGNIFLVDHPNDGPWTYRAIDNLALHPGKTPEVTIELIEGVMVEGKVVDAATGDPVPDVFIGMYGPARPHSGAAIMGATTDKKGQYRFRLPPGKTQLYTAGGPPWSYAGQDVEVPADAHTFITPDLKVKKAKPAEPAPKPAPAPEPAKAAKASTTGNPAGTETWEFAGVVRDVSDAPIGGATVIAALLDQDTRIDRQIVTTGPDGRFTLKLTGPKDPKPLIKIYAFKEGLAPVGASATESDDALTLVLARTRPFACLVQDHDEKPIAGATARVQSVKAPVPEGQGMMVTEFSWPALEGTPMEGALLATSDKTGLIRLPSMPARSQVNLAVTAKGMRTHRTTDFTLPGMTGRWPSGFNKGFLSGNSDWPATLYLDPDKEPKRFRQDR
jgi:protocatechuate 3,4-dioxygenase beta subunit